MDYFYDGQIRRYLSQFINVMSNFAYRDAKGNLTRVPVRYGDMTRQVAQLLRKNSENAIPSAPFIACYIKDIQFDRPRLQDPTFVSKIHIRERDINTATNTYINTQGSNYTVERIMPSPYLLSLNADIWTTSAEQKLQLWEQIVVFFNPSLEIQTTDNYVDWTSLSVLHLESQVWTTRAVPQGVNEDIDILSLTFSAPVWITPPAKVRKLGIVTKIISNLFAENIEGPIKTAYDRTGESAIFNDFSPDEEVTVTPGNYELLVLNGTARLISQAISNSGIDITDPRNSTSWHTILNMYPGKFRASLTQLRFAKAGENEVVATISLDPSDDKSMILSVDQDTIPSNTILSGRGTIDAIVNPITYKPSGVTAGTRFLILEGLNLSPDFGQPGYDGPVAWKNSDGSDFRAHANDIISWNGTSWGIVFDSTTATGVIYVTNSYTGTQYQFENGDWVKSYEGVYQNKLWRLIL
jgi:hypothetical protein